MQDNGNVLAFMAHPDDVEFLCAGTLARLHGLGYSIHLATSTAGGGGSVEMDPEEITRVRLQEAREAASVLDASYDCAGQKDFQVCYVPEVIRKYVEIVRRTQPFLVITHSPADYMLDHEITSQLVRNAAFCASAPNMKTDALPAASPTPAIPYLYYASPIEGRDAFGEIVSPSFRIDVGETIETKAQMLTCHASQCDWLLQHHGMDEYLESMRRWLMAEGATSGVEYAEGFRQHRGHAYPQENIIGQLLGTAEAAPPEAKQP